MSFSAEGMAVTGWGRILAVIIMLCTLPATVSASDIIIRHKGDGRTVACDSYRTEKNQRLQCIESGSGVVLDYPLADLEISYKGAEIYPYRWNDKAVSAALAGKDCSDIYKALFGAYLIDHTVDSLMYAGMLYENGTCVAPDPQKALALYRFAYEQKKDPLLQERIAQLQMKMNPDTFSVLDRDKKVYRCDTIIKGEDGIRCKPGEAVISMASLDSVFFKGMQIYPYDDDWAENVKASLIHKDCKTLYKNLYGPAFVDNAETANLYFAEMYEKGICFNRKQDTALQLYRSLLGTDYDQAVAGILRVEKKRYRLFTQGNSYLGCNELTPDGADILCDSAGEKVPRKEIRTACFEQTQIYPYDEAWQETAADSIQKGNCQVIAGAILGPAFIDDLKEAKSYLAELYEHGICVEKDTELAFRFYMDALDADFNRASEGLARLGRGTFKIFPNGRGFYGCGRIHADGRKVSCEDDNAEFLKESIRALYYNNERIYPYTDSWKEKVSDAINVKDCHAVEKYLYGPLLVDNRKDACFFMAYMLEQGVCRDKDIKESLEYYKKARDLDPEKISEKITELKTLLKSQQQERIQTARKEFAQIADQEERTRQIRQFCQSECSISNDQYDKSCFGTCQKNLEQSAPEQQ